MKSQTTELDSSSQVLLRDMCGLADEMVSGLRVMRKSPDELPAAAAYLIFFVRMTRIFHAFTIIAENGHDLEAELLARPFFETLVDWLYIESNPKNLGERYLKYQPAAQLQGLRDLNRKVDEQRFVSRYGDTVKNFCDRYCGGKPNLPRKWCEKNMEQKVEAVGPKKYYPIYRYQSNLLHNSPLVLSQYIDTSDPAILNLNTGPDFSRMEPIIGMMCSGFGLCLEKANQQFELQCESKIKSLISKVEQYATKTDAKQA